MGRERKRGVGRGTRSVGVGGKERVRRTSRDWQI